MNTKRKLVKLMSVTLLAGIACLMTTGLVFAGFDNRIYSDPDLGTLKNIEPYRNTLETNFRIRTKYRSLDVYKLSYTVLGEKVREQNSVLVNQRDDNRIRFKQFLKQAR